MTNEKDKKSIYKPRPVSGFPEWLPEVRLVEQQWMDHIRRVFESYGFCSIETPSVEELDVLRAKGEVDKEIYVIERLHKEDGEKDEARLALHFDQTVPLARYVAQHFNDLVFPFKRYQMQRVWRGERPQAGRFREFYQCDIDVINVDQLPLHFDAEMPAIIWEILSALPGMDEPFQIQLSNRKILTGLIEFIGVNDEQVKTEIFRVIDKREKIGLSNFSLELSKIVTPEGHKLIIAFMDFADKVREIGLTATIHQQIDFIDTFFNVGAFAENETFKQGMYELKYVLTYLSNMEEIPPQSIVADLSIVRGLDYYTGTVYETRFVDDPTYGSICSGGRYEDLAGSYINKKLPGVGISIGFSRLFDRLRMQNKLPVSAKSPADILMVLPSEDRRADVAKTAHILRQRGFKVEMYHAAKKIGDQFKYGSRKNIRYVWVPPFEEGGTHEIKDMINGTQHAADPETWHPQQEGKNAAVA